MKFILYTVLDTLSGDFGPVFQQKNDAMAVRAFVNGIGKNAGDFSGDLELYAIGNFDQETGEMVAFDEPQLVEIPARPVRSSPLNGQVGSR